MTGMIRRIDIPKEIRNFLKLNAGDAMEIMIEEGSVKLSKYHEETCIFCKSKDRLFYFNEFFVCPSCATSIHKKSEI